MIYEKPAKDTLIDFKKGNAVKTQEKTEVQERKSFFQRLSVFLKAWHDYFGYRPTKHKIKSKRYYRIKAREERPPKGEPKMSYYNNHMMVIRNSEWIALGEIYYKAAQKERKKAIQKDKEILWDSLKEAWKQL